MYGNNHKGSSESSSLSFAFHQFKDIPNFNWALDISDEMPLIGLFAGNEDNFDLGDASTRSCSAKELGYSSFDWFRIHSIIITIFNYFNHLLYQYIHLSIHEYEYEYLLVSVSLRISLLLFFFYYLLLLFKHVGAFCF